MAGDPPSPTEPSSRALDIGSEQTLDGRVLGLMARPTRAPSDDETLIGPGLPGPLHGRPTPAASEALPELDRSGLSPREQALVVSRYVLLSRLGAGGMGLVYLAHDPALERKVAVKLLRPGGEEREQVAEAHARLHREAQALAKLSHPNVVAVHDVGTYDASPLYGEGPRPGEPPQGVFVVMDYIEGVTLEDWLATPRPWRELLRVFIAAGRGLIAAHAVGVIHRDFKPKSECPPQTPPLPPSGRILADRGDLRGAMCRVVPRHAAFLATDWQRRARVRARTKRMSPLSWQGLSGRAAPPTWAGQAGPPQSAARLATPQARVHRRSRGAQSLTARTTQVGAARKDRLPLQKLVIETPSLPPVSVMSTPAPARQSRRGTRSAAGGLPVAATRSSAVERQV